MICNQCGKNNPFGVKECTYCGTPMPAKSGCGGFEDILTYKPPVAPAPAASTPSTGMGGTGGYGTNPTLRGPAVPQKPAPKNHFALYGMIVALVLIVALFISVNNLSATVKKLTDAQQKSLDTIELLDQRLAEVEARQAESKGRNLDSGMTTVTDGFSILQEKFKLAYGGVVEGANSIVTPPVVTDPSGNQGVVPKEKENTDNLSVITPTPTPESSWITRIQ